MDTQFKEHHNKAKLPGSQDFASAIGQHACVTGHYFRADDITYLATESNKIARGIKESIFTRVLDPSLNRGGGFRHNLPHVFDNIIQEAIRPATSATPMRAQLADHHSKHQ
jgi:hypothetical protein